ncbi:MAG TPA: P-II family nitrogen regulator [Tissierellaceae bacterium]|nr:P-II family nitrogen regulator [Tissierellaceae bacterium]
MIKDYSLFCIIVDFGEANKMLKEAKKMGVTGGTFFLGKGTTESHLLNILGLNEIRKEILIMILDKNLEDNLFEKLNDKFHLNKPNHGIAFSMPLNNCIGLRKSKDSFYKSKGDEITNMEYEAIFTIVDKGKSDKVLESAKSAGSTGGTVIHGRGSGSQEKMKLFDIEIEPEKDIILILSKIETTEAIVSSINKDLNLDIPGSGIIFVLDVNKTLGLFQD